jgi:hypothetical protein
VNIAVGIRFESHSSKPSYQEENKRRMINKAVKTKAGRNEISRGISASVRAVYCVPGKSVPTNPTWHFRHAEHWLIAGRFSNAGLKPVTALRGWNRFLRTT